MTCFHYSRHLVLAALWQLCVSCGDNQTPPGAADANPGSVDASVSDASTLDAAPLDATGADAGGTDAQPPSMATDCSDLVSAPAPDEAPAVAIVFPPLHALTDRDLITVRGCAAHENPVTAIRVNGVDATTSNGFVDWQATVPLSDGVNDLVVESADDQGHSSADAARTQVTLARHPLLRPVDIEVDASNARALVLDIEAEMLAAVDMVTGVRTLLSGAALGSGPSLFDARDSLAHDPAGNAAYVIHQGTIVRVDLGTGDRTVLSPVGPLPHLNSAEYLALDALNGRLLVSNVFDEQIVAVDLATGARSEFSGPSTGSGPALDYPSDIAVDLANNRALVAQGVPATIVAVDLTTGVRSVFASPGVGSGPWNIGASPTLALDVSGNRLFATTYLGGALTYAIDLTTGDRTVVASEMVGSGPLIDFPRGMSVDEMGGRLLLVDSELDAVFAIAVGSGDRSLLAHDTIGSGASLTSPGDSAIDRAGARIFAGQGANAIQIIDIPSGHRSVLWENPMPVPYNGIYGLTLDSANDRLLLVDGVAAALSAFDPVTTDFTALAGDSVGAGPPLFPIRDFAVNAAGDRAFSLQTYCTSEDGPCYARVLSIDLTTGDRTLVSEGHSGVGPFLQSANAIVHDAGDNRVLVLVRHFPADDSECQPIPAMVVAVDLTTGVRTAITGAGSGSGPALVDGSGMAFAPDDGRLFVTWMRSCFSSVYPKHAAGVTEVDVATGVRTIIADAATGRGPLGQTLSEPTIDTAADYALMAGGRRSIVLAVDLRTHERVIVSR